MPRQPKPKLSVPTEADILEAAVLDGEAYRTDYFFLTGEDGDVGVAEGEAVNDVVGRGHDIEEAVVVVPIEDNFAITSRFDCDGNDR